MNTILVTGATGNVGRPLITELCTAGVTVRAVTRHPEAAEFEPGVEVVDSAAAGLPGATAVFLNSRALGAELPAIVELARECGVRRLVGLSAINADDDFARQPSRFRGDRNKEVEEAAMTSGLEWVSLRPTVFASNFAGMWGPQIQAGDVVSGPYPTASTAVIAEADIAAVAARALLTDDLVGQRVPLTGPQALTNTELVETIGAALGRRLRYQEVTPELVRKRFADIGFPAGFADAYLAFLSATVDRRATVSGDVETILDRPAESFAHWVAGHRHLFESRAATHV